MDQIQVQIVQAEVFKGFTYCRFDSVTTMTVAPEFAGDVEVFAFDDAFVDFGGDALANFFLVAVDVGAIEMAVADVDGVLDRLGYFTGFGLEE